MNEPNIVFCIFAKAIPLFAYLGPGMAGGVIAAIFGLIIAFFIGLFGIIYYPIKRALKNKKSKKKNLSQGNNNKSL